MATARYILAALAATLALYAMGAMLDQTDPTGALCDTDTDCAELCPAGDAECDGGPQE